VTEELNPGEIALKVMEGKLLTQEEFELSQERGIYSKELTYEDLKSTHYVGPKRFGYICCLHRTRKESGHKDERTGHTFSCGFGLHTENLNRSHLSKLNIGLLVELWGPEIINTIPD